MGFHLDMEGYASAGLTLMSGKTSEKATCRLCRRVRPDRGPLITPCHCSHPDVRYCHQGCLANWIRDGKPDTCDFCGFQYIYKSKILLPRLRAWRCTHLLPLLLELLVLVGVLIHASYVGIQYLLPLAMLWLSSPSDASTTLKLEVDGKYDETVDFVITQMGLLSAGAATILCMYFEGTVQPLAILVSWVMGSRHISVEDVSDAKTPAQNMPDVEEGLKCDGEAEANGKSTLCDRCDEETVRRCYICKEGPPDKMGNLFQLCYCNKVFHRRCLYKEIRFRPKCRACGFQFLVAKGVRSHPYWSYSLKGVFLLILPCVVALLVQVTIPILWLFDRKVIHIPGFNRAREMDSTAIFSLMATLLLATAVFCNVVFLVRNIINTENKFTIIQDVSGKTHVWYQFVASGTIHVFAMQVDSASAQHMIRCNKRLESNRIFNLTYVDENGSFENHWHQSSLYFSMS